LSNHSSSILFCGCEIIFWLTYFSARCDACLDPAVLPDSGPSRRGLAAAGTAGGNAANFSTQFFSPDVSGSFYMKDHVYLGATVKRQLGSVWYAKHTLRKL